MTLTLSKKKCREGLNVCMNYEFNLLNHVGVVAKRVCAAAAAAAAAETAAETAAHEGTTILLRGKNEMNRALGHLCAHIG